MSHPRHAAAAILAALLPLIAACGTTSSGGTTALVGCTLVPDQQATTMDCPFTASLPVTTVLSNAPAAPGAVCGPGSVQLSGQTAGGTGRLVLGAPGPDGINDDTDQRVRTSLTVGNGTYSGTAGLVDPTDPTCVQVTGPAQAISGTWTAVHTALVSKEQVPNCVFQSQIQVTAMGTEPLTGASVPAPTAVNDSIAARLGVVLDSIVADRIDGTRRPSRGAQRSPGRCPGDWTPL